MRILIANDDGYLAPGIAALVQACQGLGEIDVNPLIVRTDGHGVVAADARAVIAPETSLSKLA